jgi:DNA primase
MITKDLLRAIRNDLPMKLTVVRLGRHGPIAKYSDGYFRFQCPRCDELRATVNPKNNLAHCFSCGENFNNIDLMMIQGHDFLPAVEILRSWLDEYRRDLGRSNAGAESNTSRRSVAE